MIRKLLTLLILLTAALSSSAYTNNQDHTIRLDSEGRGMVFSERLGDWGYITFRVVGIEDNKAILEADLQNKDYSRGGSDGTAILVFHNDNHEKNLKKRMRPKVTFDKKYVGDKDNRKVDGFKLLPNEIMVFPISDPEQTIMRDTIPLESPTQIVIPMYLAKYKEKDLHNKRLEKTTFKIFEPALNTFTITVKSIWTENNPDYVSFVGKVAAFKDSLKDVTFCPGKKHIPSLEEQQRPYREKQQELMERILGMRNTWMSDQPAYKAYDALYKELENINLNSFSKTCGKCSAKPGGGGGRPTPSSSVHSCGNCSLSAEQIYTRIKRVYEQLYTKKISKASAQQQAEPLYNCFKSNKKRQAGNFGPKITKFYNQINSY